MLAAVVVDEDHVQRLAAAVRRVAWDRLGSVPWDFELHGYEIWNGRGHWLNKSYEERIAVYEQAITILSDLDIGVAHASIHKQRLHDRHNGSADGNAYLLALQFLLEKIDTSWSENNKILVADEAKEHQLRAIKMVSDLQEWGDGEASGRKLTTIIDSMHFVSSHASSGVQIADLVAFAKQRKSNGRDSHPNAVAAIDRINSVINEQTRTWRQSWPAS